MLDNLKLKKTHIFAKKCTCWKKKKAQEDKKFLKSTPVCPSIS